MSFITAARTHDRVGVYENQIGFWKNGLRARGKRIFTTLDIKELIQMAWYYAEKKRPSTEKLIIELSLGGPSREYNPHVPYTPSEIATETSEAYKLGASLVHWHPRDEEGVIHTLATNPELAQKTIELIRKNCPDILLDLTLGGGQEGIMKDTVKDRLKPVLELGLPIELGIIYCGSINISEWDVYLNRKGYMKQAALYMQQKGVKPVLSCSNIRMIMDAKEILIDTGILNKPPVFLLYFGGEKSLPSTLETIRFVTKILPPDSIWMAGVEGRNWLQLAVETIMLGGHLKVGTHNSIYMYPHKDELIKKSADVVAKVSLIAKELGREVATPDEARNIFGIKMT